MKHSKPQTATPQQINKLTGRYTGEELRPYNGRPGAMDAFTKPSRVGDTYLAHKPMSGMGSGAK